MALTRRRLLGAVTTGCLALAGCTSGGNGGNGGAGGGSDGGTTAGESGDSPSGSGNASVAATVAMADVAFDPVRVSVDSGATVEWVNDDGFRHDVTAAQFHDSATDWGFAESLASGASTTYTFEDSGVYEYYCTIHGKGGMCGAVLVGDASLDASLPCESGGDDGGDASGGDGGYGGDGY